MIGTDIGREHGNKIQLMYESNAPKGVLNITYGEVLGCVNLQDYGVQFWHSKYKNQSLSMVRLC